MSEIAKRQVEKMKRIYGDQPLAVAVHRVPHVTRDGHACTKWCDLVVVVGPSPFGPRGGTGGIVVSGQRVARYPYRDREQAYNFAAELEAEIATTAIAAA